MFLYHPVFFKHCFFIVKKTCRKTWNLSICEPSPEGGQSFETSPFLLGVRTFIQSKDPEARIFTLLILPHLQATLSAPRDTVSRNWKQATIWCSLFAFGVIQSKIWRIHTVDGRNPAWDVKFTVDNAMNYQPQLVLDFFHQQYVRVMVKHHQSVGILSCSHFNMFNPSETY